jgi:hypothetical protein
LVPSVHIPFNPKVQNEVEQENKCV